MWSSHAPVVKREEDVVTPVRDLNCSHSPWDSLFFGGKCISKAVCLCPFRRLPVRGLELKGLQQSKATIKKLWHKKLRLDFGGDTALLPWIGIRDLRKRHILLCNWVWPEICVFLTVAYDCRIDIRTRSYSWTSLWSHRYEHDMTEQQGDILQWH